MDKNEYAQYGDIGIEDTGYGFRVILKVCKMMTVDAVEDALVVATKK